MHLVRLSKLSVKGSDCSMDRQSQYILNKFPYINRKLEVAHRKGIYTPNQID
jgi:hypothetical protein